MGSTHKQKESSGRAEHGQGMQASISELLVLQAASVTKRPPGPRRPGRSAAGVLPPRSRSVGC